MLACSQYCADTAEKCPSASAVVVGGRHSLDALYGSKQLGREDGSNELKGLTSFQPRCKVLELFLDGTTEGDNIRQEATMDSRPDPSCS